jgi:hypothetical protein
MGRGTVRRLSWELERPYSAPSLRGVGASLSITGDPGKWRAVERESEGVVVAIEGRDNITRSERRAPASSMHGEGVVER